MAGQGPGPCSPPGRRQVSGLAEHGSGSVEQSRSLLSMMYLINVNVPKGNAIASEPGE